MRRRPLHFLPPRDFSPRNPPCLSPFLSPFAGVCLHQRERRPNATDGRANARGAPNMSPAASRDKTPCVPPAASPLPSFISYEGAGHGCARATFRAFFLGFSFLSFFRPSLRRGMGMRAGERTTTKQNLIPRVHGTKKLASLEHKRPPSCTSFSENSLRGRPSRGLRNGVVTARALGP